MARGAFFFNYLDVSATGRGDSKSSKGCTRKFTLVILSRHFSLRSRVFTGTVGSSQQLKGPVKGGSGHSRGL